MRISDLPQRVTTAKAHWVASNRSLDFTPVNLTTTALSRCASIVVRQARNGYVLDYITRAIEIPNAGYEDDPDYLSARAEHEPVAGKLIAVHLLRPGNGRSQRAIIGDSEYEKLQNMWSRDGSRCRWAVSFPIVESFDIPTQPYAVDIFGSESYRRLFAHPATFLRPLTGEEQSKLAELEITPRPATNTWIAIEDEIAIAVRDEGVIPKKIALDINRDLAGCLEGLPEERRGMVRTRAVWNAYKFVRERQRAERLICDDCNLDPMDRIAGRAIKPRALLDVHHREPLAEGVRYTRPTDEFFKLLCPTCHRLEHAVLRLR